MVDSSTQPTPAVLPPATLGMLGGGQLGRFFVGAAHELGYEVWVLDPDPDSPAGRLADRHLVAAYDDHGALDRIAEGCAAVTTEFENVPAGTLDHLARTLPVRPAAAAVAVCQDRIAEKSFLQAHGFPCGPFLAVGDEGDIRAADPALFPAVVKVSRFGYDGRGQAVVDSLEEAVAAFVGFDRAACVLERRLTLDRELSVVLVRDGDGGTRCFPVAENRHVGGILDTTVVPARVEPAVADEAQRLGVGIAEELGYVGVLAVELFVSEGRLLVNELAPRPHNSGHHTIDACVTDQFEQQVRALCGLPLGEARAHSSAVMVNLLGDVWLDGAGGQPDWARLHAVPGLRLHLYGKREARRGRKMGHFTVVGDDQASVLEAALAARAAIGIGDG
jgi:5-(carboxyamino)imidazole ribonucleotide synthase